MSVELIYEAAPDTTPINFGDLFIDEDDGHIKVRFHDGTIIDLMGSVVAPRQGDLTGTINGSNTDFTIPSAARDQSLMIFVNGQKQRQTSDYTVSGDTTIVFAVPPVATPEPDVLEYYYIEN